MGGGGGGRGGWGVWATFSGTGLSKLEFGRPKQQLVSLRCTAQRLGPRFVAGFGFRVSFFQVCKGLGFRASGSFREPVNPEALKPSTVNQQ